LCNHTKKEPASWQRSQQRYEERQRKAEARVEKYEERVAQYRQALAELEAEAQDKQAEAPPEKLDKVRARYEKRFGVARRRIDRAEAQLEKARNAVGKIKAQALIAAKKRTWNLGTSLKSYIDPRVYYEWGQEVEYDVLDRYYPKALRQKFAWVKDEAEGQTEGDNGDRS
jgi:DNA topoisomerase-1